MTLKAKTSCPALLMLRQLRPPRRWLMRQCWSWRRRKCRLRSLRVVCRRAPFHSARRGRRRRGGHGGANGGVANGVAT